MQKGKIISLVFILLIVGCASVLDVKEKGLKEDIPIMVLPFVNNTDTPMAGLRASSIVEGVFRAKGFNVVGTLRPIKTEEFSSEDIKRLIEQAKKDGVRYVLTGSVNEWRYKTGIDGEPAVSMTITIIDTETDMVVWNATGSKSGWGHHSIGTTTQQLINHILDKAGF